jgi:aspartate kinase
VLLAAALRADRCELIKDVAGYYTADPHVHADAAPIRSLSFERALTMAHDGCDLVQPAALETARRSALPIVVRSLAIGAPVTHVYTEAAGKADLKVCATTSSR